MDYLFYDVFKDGKTIADAPLSLFKKESDFAWDSTRRGETVRFFPLATDEQDIINGAVVHLRGIPTPEDADKLKEQVPWIKHGFSNGRVVPIGNFVSVSKLFGQNGKYRGTEPVQRSQPFSTDPCVTWYVIVTAKDASSYDSAYGLEDALECVRLWKGGIAEEIFDVVSPEQGKVLRLKANDRGEVEQYVATLPSVKGGAVDVEILRTKSQMAWEIFF